jgi:general secretion pathway protein N
LISIRHPRRWLIATGIVAYFISLLATLPAAWLAFAISRASANQVMLLQPRGSAWSGQAQLVLATPPATPVYIGAVRWSLSPWRTLTLSVHSRITLQRKHGLAQATVDLRRSGLTLTGVRADLDAATLASLVPAASFLGIGGRVIVHAPMLRLGPGNLGGNARVEWDEARISTLGSRPFGSYRARVTAEKDTLHLDLRSATGTLRILGTGSWAPFTTGQMVFQGTIESLDPTRIPSNALSVIGRDAGNGKRSIQFRQTRRLAWFGAQAPAVSVSATRPLH